MFDAKRDDHCSKIIDKQNKKILQLKNKKEEAIKSLEEFKIACETKLNNSSGVKQDSNYYWELLPNPIQVLVAVGAIIGVYYYIKSYATHYENRFNLLIDRATEVRGELKARHFGIGYVEKRHLEFFNNHINDLTSMKYYADQNALVDYLQEHLPGLSKYLYDGTE